MCYNIERIEIERMRKSEKNIKTEKKHKYDKGQIFVKVMAGVLALLMVVGTVASLVYALI